MAATARNSYCAHGTETTDPTLSMLSRDTTQLPARNGCGQLRARVYGRVVAKTSVARSCPQYQIAGNPMPRGTSVVAGSRVML